MILAAEAIAQWTDNSFSLTSWGFALIIFALVCISDIGGRK